MDTSHDLMPLLASWKLAIQAERKAPYTIDSYIRGVQYYLQWCDGAEPLERATLQRWVTHLLDQGAEAATARIRQQAFRRFAAWLADPEVAEIDADPFLGIKPPQGGRQGGLGAQRRRDEADGEGVRRQGAAGPPG